MRTFWQFIENQTQDVAINVERYSASLKTALEGVVDHYADKEQRLAGSNIEANQIIQAMRSLGMDKLIPEMEQALQSQDPYKIQNMAFSLDTHAPDWRRGLSNYGEFRKLRHLIWDYAEKLEMKTGKYRGYKQEDADRDYQTYVQETAKKMQTIADNIRSSIARIDQWNGSKITVEARELGKDDNIGPMETASIYFGTGNMAPFFSYFTLEGKIEIDDVLEAGDDDFFTDSRVQADYFNLIRELRKPGSTQTTGRTLTLYTARPAKDRQRYMDAKTVPTNIFLTNRYDSAEGIGRDMGERDVWKVKIDSRYLVQTLEGMEKQYQVVGDKEVPVISMELITPYEK